MSASRLVPWLLCAALALGSASCSRQLPSQPGNGTGPPPSVIEPVSDSLLQASLERWSEARVESYRYRFNWRCFCEQSVVRTVDITVVRGVITSVTDVLTGQRLSDVDAARYQPVEGLFDLVRDAVDSPADWVGGAFDSKLGFPTSLYVDYAFGLADDETGFRIYWLTRVPGWPDPGFIERAPAAERDP